MAAGSNSLRASRATMWASLSTRARGERRTMPARASPKTRATHVDNIISNPPRVRSSRRWWRQLLLRMLRLIYSARPRLRANASPVHVCCPPAPLVLICLSATPLRLLLHAHSQIDARPAWRPPDQRPGEFNWLSARCRASRAAATRDRARAAIRRQPQPRRPHPGRRAAAAAQRRRLHSSAYRGRAEYSEPGGRRAHARSQGRVTDGTAARGRTIGAISPPAPSSRSLCSRGRGCSAAPPTRLSIPGLSGIFRTLCLQRRCVDRGRGGA
jgi:hypothetical protein